MKINKMLDAAHQLDAATFNAICLDLDQNPISDRPETSAGEKQRDDGDYDRVVEEAFKVRPPPNIQPCLRFSHRCVSFEGPF